MKKHKKAIEKRFEDFYKKKGNKLELQVIDLKQLVKEKDTALRVALRTIDNLKEINNALAQSEVKPKVKNPLGKPRKTKEIIFG